MSRIRGKNTKPEVGVRSILHKMGYRFRLHGRRLPGTPDIVLAKYQTVVFVHGCFWHRHKGCEFAYTPKSRVKFWEGKFASNVERDTRHQTELVNLGWDVITVWECELRQPDELAQRLDEHLANRLEDLNNAMPDSLKAKDRVCSLG